MNDKAISVTIVLGNQKGGVGKTSNCIHLAAALGQRGYRCLIIDLDPAAGATKHLGIQMNSFAGTLELLTTDESIKNLAIVEGMPDGVPGVERPHGARRLLRGDQIGRAHV